MFAEDEADLLMSSAQSSAELEAMVQRRVVGEPIEYVTGWTEFCGIRIEADPAVFVPRPRTEFLVERAVRVARAGDVVLDLCCGTGAIGLAVHAALPAISVFASDLDPVAVRCARRNLAGTGAEVFQGDLWDALPVTLRGTVNLLLMNLPYVPTAELEMLPREARLYEPAMSLDGGPDGLALLRRVAVDAPGWLAPGGHALVEVSAGQADAAAGIFAAVGLAPAIAASEDLEVTVVSGWRL